MIKQPLRNELGISFIVRQTKTPLKQGCFKRIGVNSYQAPMRCEYHELSKLTAYLK